MEPIFFDNQEHFREWLAAHHATARELLVGFYKSGSGRPNMTWSKSVDQALCFGWIDGVRTSIDEHRYKIRFTPRKPGSIWSAVNIKKIAELQASGLLQPAGLAIFEQRAEHKSRIYSYENEPATFSEEFLTALKENTEAWRFFQSQAPSYQRAATAWVMGAKQEKTKISRFELLVLDSSQGRKLERYSKWTKK